MKPRVPARTFVYLVVATAGLAASIAGSILPFVRHR